MIQHPFSLWRSPLAALLGTATLAVCLSVGTSAPAQSTFNEDVVTVDLLPGWREADGTHFAGVRIRLAPGWKTYWRTPGDGGIPPVIELSGSSNLRHFETHLPRPTVFDEDGARSIGYKDEVVFPLALATADPAAPIVLDGSMFIGVCREICMPAEIGLQATLSAPGQSSALIATALADQPRVLSGSIECTFTPTPNGLRIAAALEVPAHSGEAAVIEIADPTLWVDHATARREADTLLAEAEIFADRDNPLSIARNQVRVTVLSPDAAYEVHGCAAG